MPNAGIQSELRHKIERPRLQGRGFFAMDEKRNIQRHRILKSGTISFNRGGGIDCMVRNLSTTGACLEVASPLGIPDDFNLIIVGDHDHHPCHVAWRSEKGIGVAFK
jgi:hypothetical protein